MRNSRAARTIYEAMMAPGATVVGTPNEQIDRIRELIDEESGLLDYADAQPHDFRAEPGDHPHCTRCGVPEGSAEAGWHDGRCPETLPSEEEFFILSLKHSKNRDNVYTWWGPNNGGYVWNLADAGRYKRHEIESELSYYNNGESTLAIPVDAVLGMAMQTVAYDPAKLKKLERAAFAKRGEQ